MHLLADENLHADLVTWPRSQGHDVLYAAEVFLQQEDSDLLQIAQSQERIVITDDKDFGELIFRRQMATHGVRLYSPDVILRIARLQEAWDVIRANQPGNFIVITNDRIRLRRPGT
jgi:uncharacterized protein with PIN domain